MDQLKFQLHKRYFILAEELYQKSEPDIKTPNFGIQRRSRLFGAIIFLGFALESFINEIGLEYCRDIFDSIERLPPPEKWFLISKFKSKDILNRGREPFLSILTIFQLRNYFAHFKPQFKDENSPDYIRLKTIDHKLVKKLYYQSIEAMKILSKELKIDDNDWLETKNL